MDKMYRDRSIRRYTNDLAAKLPAPGGGSAAALNAALGAALISMVVNFTLGKPKYQQYERELKEILEKAEKLREEFLNLIDLDVVAYKSGNIRSALDVPFMLARLCLEAMKLCLPLVKKGNINLISDVAVAAIFLESAFTAAYVNVEINLKLAGEKKLAGSIRRELDQKQKTVRRIRQDTEVKVGEIIRG